SLHDFAVLRAINNIVVVAPADNYEAEQAVRLAAAYEHPVYIRFGKKVMPLLESEEGAGFEFGKGRVICRGDDLILIATGEAVYPARQAARKLEREKGMRSTVISMH